MVKVITGKDGERDNSNDGENSSRWVTIRKKVIKEVENLGVVPLPMEEE